MILGKKKEDIAHNFGHNQLVVTIAPVMEKADDASGYSVSLSANGNIVAIGAVNNDANGNNNGHVRVYSWNGSTWDQVGNDIDGEMGGNGDFFGFSVSLSDDGNIVAIGGPKNDGTDTDAGHVRVYSWNGCVWSQLGSDIDGEYANDKLAAAFSK